MQSIINSKLENFKFIFNNLFSRINSTICISISNQNSKNIDSKCRFSALKQYAKKSGGNSIMQNTNKHNKNNKSFVNETSESLNLYFLTKNNSFSNSNLETVNNNEAIDDLDKNHVVINNKNNIKKLVELFVNIITNNIFDIYNTLSYNYYFVAIMFTICKRYRFFIKNIRGICFNMISNFNFLIENKNKNVFEKRQSCLLIKLNYLDKNYDDICGLI